MNSNALQQLAFLDFQPSKEAIRCKIDHLDVEYVATMDTLRTQAESAFQKHELHMCHSP